MTASTRTVSPHPDQLDVGHVVRGVTGNADERSYEIVAITNIGGHHRLPHFTVVRLDGPKAGLTLDTLITAEGRVQHDDVTLTLAQSAEHDWRLVWLIYRHLPDTWEPIDRVRTGGLRGDIFWIEPLQIHVTIAAGLDGGLEATWADADCRTESDETLGVDLGQETLAEAAWQIVSWAERRSGAPAPPGIVAERAGARLEDVERTLADLEAELGGDAVYQTGADGERLVDPTAAKIVIDRVGMLQRERHRLDLLEEAREEARRERIAEDAHQRQIRRRDDAIRQAYRAGSPVRDLVEATGLSRVHIHRMVRDDG